MADVVYEREVLMKWSLPLVELSRPATCCASPLFAAFTFVVIALPLSAGCSSLPVMHSDLVQVAMQDVASRIDVHSDAEKLRLSQLPITPDFDTPTVGTPSKDESVATNLVETENQKTTSATPQPVEANRPVEVASVAPVSKTPSDKPAAMTAVQPSETTSKVIRTGPADAAPAIAGSGKKSITQSSVQVPMLRIDAPKPFAWTSIAKTSGERSFQTVTIGADGYRSLVIGSVAGNDPLALELIEQLARHLHNGKTILGGFQSTVLRTLNPDGEALHNVLNAKGQYINHGFPKDNGIADGNQPVEVTFLLTQIDTLQPQRVIHVRSIEGDKGLVAASSGCLSMASESAEWLGFRVINLPGKAVSGSLERFLASSGRCEVITFAIPATANKTELWDRYGDALQNLLLSEDIDARELARQQTQQSSANSRDDADR